MRKLCEGQPECGLPALAGKPFDQSSLCGYDPAPLADAQFKGVYVEFACVRPGPTTDALVQNPGSNPVTGKPWDPKEIFSTTLRSSQMSIRCPYPAAGAQ
jgi:hypothetical protein